MSSATEQTSHVPDFIDGPYDVFIGNANGRGLIRIEAGGESPEAGHHIASMTRGARSEATAMELVRRFNCHDDLLEALKAAIECGMVPTSSATEGGAMRHVRQAQVADMIRAAIKKAEGR